MTEIEKYKTSVYESRAARRLRRLFRIEHTGGFERRPFGIRRQLIERRAALVEELVALDSMRRSHSEPRSAELDQALAELTGEVSGVLDLARTRVERITADLRIRHGEGLSTGIRDTGVGQLLGKS